MSKGKVSLSADQISEKWGRRLKGAVSDIQTGIENVTESPMEKAVAKQDKMRQNIVESIDSGRWAAGMRKVSLSDWKTKTSKKVAERLASGVEGAMDKRQEFDKYLVSELNTVLPEIQKMPDLTLEDSVARARKLMEHMSKNKYKK